MCNRIQDNHTDTVIQYKTVQFSENDEITMPLPVSIPF